MARTSARPKEAGARASTGAPKRASCQRAGRHRLGRQEHARSHRPQPAPVRDRRAHRQPQRGRLGELAYPASGAAGRRGRREPRTASSRSGWQARGIEAAAGMAALIEAASRPGRLRDGRHQRRGWAAPDARGRLARPPRGARQQGMPGRARARCSWRPCARRAPSWCRSIQSIPPCSRRSPARTRRRSSASS